VWNSGAIFRFALPVAPGSARAVKVSAMQTSRGVRSVMIAPQGPRAIDRDDGNPGVFGRGASGRCLITLPAGVQALQTTGLRSGYPLVVGPRRD
jgi:hypothetical protein